MWDEEEGETGLVTGDWSVDRDNMRYLNAIYHGADNTRLGGRISGELTPGYFLSADAVRTRTSLQSDQWPATTTRYN